MGWVATWWLHLHHVRRHADGLAVRGGDFQAFHRALVLKKQPLGAGLPRSLEWSRIDGGPNTQLLRKWFQIYVDDFDLAELVEIELVEKLLHTKSDLQKEVEAAYRRGHIASLPRRPIPG